MKEIEARVYGKVQLVMFRDFAARKARGLDLVGEVENLPDRSVRIVAQGEEKNLTRLLEHLHKGPFLAHVSRVDISWREPSHHYVGFKIIF